jgi:chaperonin cofactor prefoldin
MPTVDDVYNKVVEVNTHLVEVRTSVDNVKTSVDATKNAVNQVNTTLLNGFSQLVALGQYTNLALSQNAKQNDTIICILEHISQNTCGLLNQSVVQTRLQTEMEKDLDALESMYETVNGAAALERERLEALKRQIEACCPPRQPDPPCHYTPCPAPAKLPDPPKQPNTPVIG